MLTPRTARGAVLLARAAATVTVLAATLTGCSGSSAVSAVPVTTTSAPAPATTSSAPTPAPTSSTRRATASRTTSGEPTGTRTVYAGPSRTSTLVPWDEPSVRAGGGGPTPSAPAGTAALTILLDDGFGIRATWTLTCDPVGGTHPHAAVACGVLGARGAKAFPPAGGGGCDQQYGGPQKALVTGTWRGRPVRSQFTLENGCEIARWTAMIGLLPPGGA